MIGHTIVAQRVTRRKEFSVCTAEVIHAREKILSGKKLLSSMAESWCSGGRTDKGVELLRAREEDRKNKAALLPSRTTLYAGFLAVWARFLPLGWS